MQNRESQQLYGLLEDPQIPLLYCTEHNIFTKQIAQDSQKVEQDFCVGFENWGLVRTRLAPARDEQKGLVRTRLQNNCVSCANKALAQDPEPLIVPVCTFLLALRIYF